MSEVPARQRRCALPTAGGWPRRWRLPAGSAPCPPSCRLPPGPDPRANRQQQPVGTKRGHPLLPPPCWSSFGGIPPVQLATIALHGQTSYPEGGRKRQLQGPAARASSPGVPWRDRVPSREAPSSEELASSSPPLPLAVAQRRRPLVPPPPAEWRPCRGDTASSPSRATSASWAAPRGWCWVRPCRTRGWNAPPAGTQITHQCTADLCSAC